MKRLIKWLTADNRRVPPWHFWNPRSGMAGGLIMGVLLSLVLSAYSYLLIKYCAA